MVPYTTSGSCNNLVISILRCESIFFSLINCFDKIILTIDILGVYYSRFFLGDSTGDPHVWYGDLSNNVLNIGSWSVRGGVYLKGSL